jgi:Na+-translocating ferredoxin:NAD+ oxidoreductase RnfD subunit
MIGYYVLLVGMLVVGVAMPFTEPAWKIVNAALLAVVLAEVVRDGVILLSYRRGWHG